MNFISMVFDYDLNKLSNIGRKWSYSVYKGKDFVFEYSAASIASVLKYNKNNFYEVYTDDIELLKSKINKYDVSTDNLSLIDWSDKLYEWKKVEYPLYCSMMMMKHNSFFSKENFVRLDNDLICKKEFNEPIEPKVTHIWKKEGIVGDGDWLWGERFICEKLFGETNFMRNNIGVLSLHKEDHYLVEQATDIAEKLVSIDIRDITDVDSSIWHCCDQTAYNWLFYKNNFKIIETDQWFNHHFAIKQNCIIEAQKYLR